MKNFIIGLILMFGIIAVNQDANAQSSTKKAKTKIVEMKVGFHCPGGKAAIEKTLAANEGVVEYDVNLQTKMVKITYKPAVTNKEKLQKAIIDLGYAVDGEAPEKKHSCGG
ncbi:MAG: heavy metal-associated domain-containing protein [Bacteroidota bacterium]